MMDEGAIRKTLEEITDEIRGLESRIDALLTAQRGLEALLGLRSAPGSKQTEMTLDAGKRNGQPVGTRSFRGAVKQVVADARGTELHATEILKRARALGASTTAKDPVAVVDLVLISLKRDGHPVEKTKPRTWRWAPSAAAIPKGAKNYRLESSK